MNAIILLLLLANVTVFIRCPDVSGVPNYDYHSGGGDNQSTDLYDDGDYHENFKEGLEDVKSKRVNIVDDEMDDENYESHRKTKYRNEDKTQASDSEGKQFLSRIFSWIFGHNDKKEVKADIQTIRDLTDEQMFDLLTLGTVEECLDVFKKGNRKFKNDEVDNSVGFDASYMVNSVCKYLSDQGEERIDNECTKRNINREIIMKLNAGLLILSMFGFANIIINSKNKMVNEMVLQESGFVSDVATESDDSKKFSIHIGYAVHFFLVFFFYYIGPISRNVDDLLNIDKIASQIDFLKYLVGAFIVAAPLVSKEISSYKSQGGKRLLEGPTMYNKPQQYSGDVKWIFDIFIIHTLCSYYALTPDAGEKIASSGLITDDAYKFAGDVDGLASRINMLADVYFDSEPKKPSKKEEDLPEKEPRDVLFNRRFLNGIADFLQTPENTKNSKLSREQEIMRYRLRLTKNAERSKLRGGVYYSNKDIFKGSSDGFLIKWVKRDANRISDAICGKTQIKIPSALELRNNMLKLKRIDSTDGVRENRRKVDLGILTVIIQRFIKAKECSGDGYIKETKQSCKESSTGKESEYPDSGLPDRFITNEMNVNVFNIKCLFIDIVQSLVVFDHSINRDPNESALGHSKKESSVQKHPSGREDKRPKDDEDIDTDMDTLPKKQKQDNNDSEGRDKKISEESRRQNDHKNKDVDEEVNQNDDSPEKINNNEGKDVGPSKPKNQEEEQNDLSNASKGAEQKDDDEEYEDYEDDEQNKQPSNKKNVGRKFKIRMKPSILRAKRRFRNLSNKVRSSRKKKRREYTNEE